MKPRSFSLRLAFAALTAALAGCSQQTLSSAQNDANHDIAVASQKATQATQEAAPQLHKLDSQTRVTAALVAAKLPTTIHVRADMRGVYLRGTVKNASDKTRAAQIARDTLGPDVRVHNELHISGE